MHSHMCLLRYLELWLTTTIAHHDEDINRQVYPKVRTCKIYRVNIYPHSQLPNTS